MPHLPFLVLTAFLVLEGAASAAPGQTSCSHAREETACTSTASDLPADGRGLLQMVVEKPASHPIATGSAAARTSPQEGGQLPLSRWHSLLQGWASRISASSHLQTLVQSVGATLVTVVAVICCLAGCMCLYTGSLLRGGLGYRPSAYGGAEQRTLTGPLLTVPRTVQRQPRPDSSKHAQYAVKTSAAESIFLCPSLVVPAGVNSVFLLNFLDPKPGACSDKVLITDLQGNQVLSAYIDRPEPGTIPQHPVVTLMMTNRDEVAKCFFRPGRNGLLFELCNQEGRPGAVLNIDQSFREQKWTLRVCSSTANTLHITGQVSNSLNAIMKDAQGEVQAEAEPVPGVPCRAKVRIYSGVDCGLVICGLLGMGELASSQSS